MAGLCSSARATISRCARPPDSAITGACARSVRWNFTSRSSAAARDAAAAHSEEAAVEVQVLPHGQRAVERVRLRHDADQLLGDRRVAHDVDAADERLAGGRDHPRREHARGRRLAGAVGSEQAEDLALGRRSG